MNTDIFLIGLAYYFAYMDAFGLPYWVLPVALVILIVAMIALVLFLKRKKQEKIKNQRLILDMRPGLEPYRKSYLERVSTSVTYDAPPCQIIEKNLIALEAIVPEGVDTYLASNIIRQSWRVKADYKNAVVQKRGDFEMPLSDFNVQDYVVINHIEQKKKKSKAEEKAKRLRIKEEKQIEAEYKKAEAMLQRANKTKKKK